jgi:hypothetical protein
MSKKKEDRIRHAEVQIALYAEELKGSKVGSLYYRTILHKIEDWIYIRKGLQLLKDMGEL